MPGVREKRGGLFDRGAFGVLQVFGLKGLPLRPFLFGLFDRGFSPVRFRQGSPINDDTALSLPPVLRGRLRPR